MKKLSDYSKNKDSYLHDLSTRYPNVLYKHALVAEGMGINKNDIGTSISTEYSCLNYQTDTLEDSIDNFEEYFSKIGMKQ